MLDIFDIHTHILPKTDDGSSSFSETMRMLKCASSQGIRRVAATPHYSVRYHNCSPERIRSLCEKIQNKAEEKGIDIEIYPGQEILYKEDIPGLLAEGKLLGIAGSRYVLIEFSGGCAYSEIFRAVREIVLCGYYPVLAHVERYRELRKPGRMEEILNQGAYTQMNFRSVSGGMFDPGSRWCRKLLKEEMIHFMGTDMHNMGSRRPETEKALKWMRRSLGKQYLHRLLKGNAEKLLLDKKIR